ncbi:helix-turn-helix domain-containing protein [Lactobacillus mulieris]|uniref:helix-turn-helix domain-containing protein n=1 Tax=Lactobacillus mulieris TaxID=2508708 RepID=UPI0022431B0A|nr:helix-turn-helix domain-containing protein [Lactobacillus mulieris]MCW8123404.1 helix-turn-helix domain-containing protein [Lactobacillus mulieris]MDK7326567.1 helix-turn-helix domain-containing protein [Lactobacillus mulieris]
MDTEFLNATNAAAYLGVSRAVFYRWQKNYQIKFYLVGGIKRYSKQDLKEFMKENSLGGR